MDNVTHTLAGLAVAQAAVAIRSRGLTRDSERYRAAFWTCSALANNFPDSDFILTPLTQGSLGFLLHHRGHTHTLVGAVPQALLLLFVFWVWSRLRESHVWTRSDWKWLAGLALAGPVIHIAMDYWNSYGVHPFWPWNSKWFYGDSIFIIEPLISLCLLPALFFAAKSRATKCVFAAASAISIGLYFFTGYVPWQLGLIITAWALWLFGLMPKLKKPVQIGVSIASASIVVILFFVVSALTANLVRLRMSEQFPTAQIRQIALSPYPSNPFCWLLHTVETSDSKYIARRAVVAPFPHFFAAAECPPNRFESSSSALKPVKAASRPDLLWLGQFETSVAELSELQKNDCHAAAFFKFSRIPFLKKTESSTQILGDLRFYRDQGRGFTDIEIHHTFNQTECPKNIPNWTPPLGEL